MEKEGADGNFGVGYAIVKTEPFEWELYAGGRFTYVEIGLSLNPPIFGQDFSESKFWIDPIVGTHAEFEMLDWLALYAKGDIGGFGVASDLTWQVEGGVEFQITRLFYLRLAYRHLSTDFEDDGFLYDTVKSGPLLEFGLHF